MLKKNVLPILFITLLLDVIGIGMLIPIIPALFTNPDSSSFMLAGYGVNSQYMIAGLVTALFGVMQFLAAPFLGDLSDTYGRKKLLTLGVGFLAIAQFLFATGIYVSSLSLLLISRAVAGVAGANFSIAQASIADVTAPENRARNFGLIGAAFGLGFILGPLLSGYIVGITHNPAIPFVLAGILGLVNLVSITLFLPETHVNKGKNPAQFSLLKAFSHIKKAYTDVETRSLYFASFLQMMGFAFFTSFISIFLVVRFGYAEAATGTFFGVIGGWMIFTQVFVVRVISKKYSERNILKFSLPVLALVILAHPFIFSEIILFTLIPIMAMAVGLISTTIPALISKGVSSDRQGAALGINGSLQALSQGLAPIIAGLLAGMGGVITVFFVGSALVLLAFVTLVYKKYPSS